MMRHSFLTCSLALLSTTVVFAEETLQSLEQAALRAAAARVAPSVVQIEAIGGLERIGKTLVGDGPTTGLIVSADGLIISSAFGLAQNPNSILVTLPDGKRKPAKIVSRDNSRMLVLLQVDTDVDLPVPEAAPVEKMQVGEWTLALGRTFSASEVNLSVGILSAKDRIWGTAIQTDAKISPGNYGGPLVDIQGRVLGVLAPLSPDIELYTADGKRIDANLTSGNEWYDSGIGFAVPLEHIFSRLDQLKKQELFKGRLGIAIKETGVGGPAEIATVRKKSPAADAGLQPGDVIIRANDQEITRKLQLRHALGPLYGGDTLRLLVKRGAEELELTPTLLDSLPKYVQPFLGILPERQAEGVVIRWVYPGGPAAEAGLLPGDRLLQLNESDVEGADQLRNSVSSLDIEDEAQLKYIRNGSEANTIARLSPLPEAIPTNLPPAKSPAGEAPAAQTGLIEIKIPEEAGNCFAYVPENYDARKSYGLLVYLPPAGEVKAETIRDEWKAICESQDLILLLPEPATPTRWEPSDEVFIRKTIDESIKLFSIGENRVVVHGYQGGGAMAYLTGFKHRDLVRGIVAVDAGVPLRIGTPEIDPINRLAILTAASEGSKLYSRINGNVEQLREIGFPVTVLELGSEPRPLAAADRIEIARWIDALDRI